MTRDDGHPVVKADVPGIKPEEITIEVAGDTLTLSGRHEESYVVRRIGSSASHRCEG